MNDLPDFLRSHAERDVLYLYLQMLAQRTARLESLLASKDAARPGERPRGEHRAAIEPEVPAPAEEPAPAVAPGFRRMTTEELLDLLPIVFDDFWGAIESADLALLASRLGLPRLEKRDFRPSEEVVTAETRRLSTLARGELGALIRFCQGMPPSLKVRRQMDLVDLRFSALR